MEDPATKLAACPIFYWANGGRLDEFGNPLRSDVQKLLCPRAFDCGQCSYMHGWVRHMVAEGFSSGWECVRCITQSLKKNEDKKVEILITGYYQAGRRALLAEGDSDFDSDRPALSGCTRIFEEDDLEVNKHAGEVCNWESSFLQLVLRRRRA